MSLALRLTSLATCLLFLGGLAVAHAENHQPAYLLEVPPSISDVFVADTESATLLRFVRTSEGLVEQDRRYMSIGRNGVGKVRAWDRRTPLGVYFVTEQLDTTNMHEKYGIAAFPLDYPNAWDRYNERTGDGIWLHGVDRRNPDRPPRDTDGCLAIPNDELRALLDRLNPLVTPVVVARNVEWARPEDIEAQRQEFRDALDGWRASLEDGDIVRHLAFYDDAFTHGDMSKADWSEFRFGVFQARPLAAVTLDEVFLAADPETDGLYLSRFSQALDTGDEVVTTTKRLYWQRSDSGELRIISEDAG